VLFDDLVQVHCSCSDKVGFLTGRKGGRDKGAERRVSDSWVARLADICKGRSRYLHAILFFYVFRSASASAIGPFAFAITLSSMSAILLLSSSSSTGAQLKAFMYCSMVDNADMHAYVEG